MGTRSFFAARVSGSTISPACRVAVCGGPFKFGQFCCSVGIFFTIGPTKVLQVPRRFRYLVFVFVFEMTVQFDDKDSLAGGWVSHLSLDGLWGLIGLVVCGGPLPFPAYVWGLGLPLLALCCAFL